MTRMTRHAASLRLSAGGCVPLQTYSERSDEKSPARSRANGKQGIHAMTLSTRHSRSMPQPTGAQPWPGAFADNS